MLKRWNRKSKDTLQTNHCGSAKLYFCPFVVFAGNEHYPPWYAYQLVVGCCGPRVVWSESWRYSVLCFTYVSRMFHVLILSFITSWTIFLNNQSRGKIWNDIPKIRGYHLPLSHHQEQDRRVTRDFWKTRRSERRSQVKWEEKHLSLLYPSTSV